MHLGFLDRIPLNTPIIAHALINRLTLQSGLDHFVFDCRPSIYYRADQINAVELI